MSKFACPKCGSQIPYFEVRVSSIWGSDRAKFGTPETKYKDARVYVRGKITSHREKPEVIATEPKQIMQEK